MLRELIECGNNIKEEMKVTLSEIKENLQGTNRQEGMKSRIKSTIWDIRKKKAFNKNSKKKKESKKTKDTICSCWDNFKRSNIPIIGVPEGEDKEQKSGNLFEKNNERKLP